MMRLICFAIGAIAVLSAWPAAFIWPSSLTVLSGLVSTCIFVLATIVVMVKDEIAKPHGVISVKTTIAFSNEEKVLIDVGGMSVLDMRRLMIAQVKWLEEHNLAPDVEQVSSQYLCFRFKTVGDATLFKLRWAGNQS